MRTMRNNAALMAGLVVIAAGCGSSVTVEVTTDGADGPQPQANLPVDFLPFNRDSVFDVLDGQAQTPRPTMSSDLQSASDRVSSLQADWREKETAWNDSREQLRSLRAELDQLDARDPSYRGKYDQFGQLEGTERRLDRERKAAFDAFTAAQNQVATRIDSFRVVLNGWEEEAYAGYYDIEQQLLGGNEVIADTTNDMGHATVSLPSGDWWATTRAPLADGEMYWNVRLPDADTVRLDSSNGQVRARL